MQTYHKNTPMTAHNQKNAAFLAVFLVKRLFIDLARLYAQNIVPVQLICYNLNL